MGKGGTILQASEGSGDDSGVLLQVCKAHPPRTGLKIGYGSFAVTELCGGSVLHLTSSVHSCAFVLHSSSYRNRPFEVLVVGPRAVSSK